MTTDEKALRRERGILADKQVIAGGIVGGLMDITSKNVIRHADMVYVNMYSGNRYEISIKLVSEENGAREVEDTDVTTQKYA